jgi:hypothetical protein
MIAKEQFVRLAINIIALGITLHDGINGRLGCADSADDARGPQPISPQRRAEYVRIFKTIGCDGAVYYSPGSKANASFSMWSVGMLFAGQDKSIMLFPGEPPTPIVETTDGYRWTPPKKTGPPYPNFRFVHLT